MTAGPRRGGTAGPRRGGSPSGFDLRPLLAPRSIAIVGASESADSWAPEIFRSLLHLGFDGDLYPVNPKYDEVCGRACMSSVIDLPRGVDLVVFVVQATKRSINRAWELAGVRQGISANVELDVMIEAANLPQRDEFRRITQEQGLKAAIAWRDARFRGEGS